MSQENVEAVRAAYEELARGDFSRIANFSDDYEFVTSPEMPDAGTYRGEAAREWTRTWVDSFDDLTVEATEIIDVDDNKIVVGVLQRGRPRGSAVTVENQSWQLLTIRDGVTVRSEMFLKRGQALEAAGLSE